MPDVAPAIAWRGATLAAAVLLACPAVPGAEVSPREVLEGEYGLRRVGSSWTIPLEGQLRAKLDALPEIRKRIVEGESALAALVRAQQQQWAQKPQLEQLQAELQRKLASASASQRPQIEEEYRRVQTALTQIVAPGELAGVAALRARMVELIAARHSLLSTVAWVREHLPQLPDQYALLAENAAVARALSRLGAGHRLGPLRDYRGEMRRLAEFEASVTRSPLFGEHAPVYLEGGRARLVLLVGDETPLTFTWATGDGPAVITANAAAAAGIAPAAGATHVLRRAGRSLTAKPATIPYLRVGGRLVRDVPVLVLPPEGEDWGSELSSSSLPGYVGQLELEQLRLRLEPATAK